MFNSARDCWLLPTILASWKAEIGRISTDRCSHWEDHSQPGKKVYRLILMEIKSGHGACLSSQQWET
jgi:hypothetical protein